jgi:hypothetical protein
MAFVVNFFCTLTALLCGALLLNAYSRVRKRLLLWSGLCFVGLTISNALLLVDFLLVPAVSLFTLRLGVAAASLVMLLYGLVFESD